MTEVQAEPPRGKTGYDVFLSHSGDDKPAVTVIAERLRAAGVAPFLDSWHLVPGEPWQEALEDALDASRACAVFIGPTGFGPWENEEMRVALSRRVKDHEYRVIPVLLPGAAMPARGRLPAFLSRTTWVDFRPGLDDAAAFDRLVSGIRGIAPVEVREDGTEDEAAIVNPFRGLEVFDEQHAEYFFGREALTQYLVEQLRDERFLSVIGSSGSGKSSVVRAGLVPALRGGALPGSAAWPIQVFRPGAAPLEALAARLVDLVGGGTSRLGSRDEILAKLRADERGLHTVAQLAVAGGADDRIVIVVDQFEEVFTQVDDEAERSRFIAALLYASSVVGGPTVVVTTMRADFFGKCAAIPGLAARLSERDVLVPPMDEAELRRAMLLPAEKVGLQFEKGLVDTILVDLGDEPGSLPLLQHTLLELFEGRRGRWLTTDRYQAIGRVQGAIASRAEKVFDRLTDVEKAAARRILLRLTQPGEGTEDTRRRATLADLKPGDASDTAAEAVVNELAAARLVTTSVDDAGDEIVDVAHEALIRGWPRLHQWVAENPAALRIHRELTHAADTWERGGRDASYLFEGPRLDETSAFAERNPGDLNDVERRFLTASRRQRQSRTVRLIAGLVAVSVVFAALGGVALLQRGDAVRSAEDAQAAKNDALRLAAESKANALLAHGVATARSQPALGTRLAVEAMARAERAGMPTSAFVDEVVGLLKTGRYAAMPTAVDIGWESPDGRFVVAGIHDAAPLLIRTDDGSPMSALSGPVELIEYPGAAGTGIFVVTYQSEEREIRRLDGSVVAASGRIAGAVVDRSPAGSTILVTYGNASDTAGAAGSHLARDTGSPTAPTGVSLAAVDSDELPPELRRASDGGLVRKLDRLASIAPLGTASTGRAVVNYLAGGFEVLDLATGDSIVGPEPDGEIGEASPDGATFIARTRGACELWSVARQASIPVGQGCRALFSPEGVVAIASDTSIDVVRTDDLEVLGHADVTALSKNERRSAVPVAFTPEHAPTVVAVETTTFAPEAGAESTWLFGTDGTLVAKVPGHLRETDGTTEPLDAAPDRGLVFVATDVTARLIDGHTGDILIDSGNDGSGLDEIRFVPGQPWYFVDWDDELALRRIATGGAVAGSIELEPFLSLWPGSDEILLIGGPGLFRYDASGRPTTLYQTPAGVLNVVAWGPGDEPSYAVVTFRFGDGAPPTSILLRDGTLVELEGRADEATLATLADRTMLLLTSAAGQTTLWDATDPQQPVRRTSTPGLAVFAWDPMGHWALATQRTGEASLIDLDWLARMDEPDPGETLETLESYACMDPLRRLAGDDDLEDEVGEPLISCGSA